MSKDQSNIRMEQYTIKIEKERMKNALIEQ